MPTSGLFHYERAFLDAAGTHIARELASAFGWAFSRDESFLFLSWIVPSSSSGDGWVTVAEVAAARTAIEETIRCPRDFPFLEVFQATTWLVARAWRWRGHTLNTHACTHRTQGCCARHFRHVPLHRLG